MLQIMCYAKASIHHGFSVIAGYELRALVERILLLAHLGYRYNIIR